MSYHLIKYNWYFDLIKTTQEIIILFIVFDIFRLHCLWLFDWCFNGTLSLVTLCPTLSLDIDAQIVLFKLLTSCLLFRQTCLQVKHGRNTVTAVIHRIIRKSYEWFELWEFCRLVRKLYTIWKWFNAAAAWIRAK